MIRISVSSNPEKEDNLISYVKEMQSYGADFMHMDVMDGNFVEEQCLNNHLVKDVRKNTVMPLDVHLMVKNPTIHILPYISAGANIITIHYETYVLDYNATKINERIDYKKLLEDVNLIRRTNHTLVGLSFKPDTKVEEILPLVILFDLVLVMSVVPGKSGQKFMEEALDRIQLLRKYIDNNNLNTLIEVDGGINIENAKRVYISGADILVIGNAVYSAENRKEIIDFIHQLKK